jgi:hypothetical protein
MTGKSAELAPTEPNLVSVFRPMLESLGSLKAPATDALGAEDVDVLLSLTPLLWVSVLPRLAWHPAFDLLEEPQVFLGPAVLALLVGEVPCLLVDLPLPVVGLLTYLFFGHFEFSPSCPN